MITAIDTNTALVLIDLQKGVVKANTVHPATEIIGKAVQLIDAFRKHNLPVVIVNVCPDAGRLPKARVNAPAALPQEPAALAAFAEIIPEIKMQPADIRITKRTWNAFFETPLHEELQKRNITQIVLAGISTSIGVDGTARAAGERGYHIAFATDAMTDRVAEAHRHSTSSIFPRIGELGTTEEIISMLP